MNKKVLKKFERFVDLSAKFKKSQSAIEKEVGFINNEPIKLTYNTGSNNTGINYGDGTLYLNLSKPDTVKQKSKGELHLEKAKEESLILEEYTEYLELIDTLKYYFCSLKELNK